VQVGSLSDLEKAVVDLLNDSRLRETLVANASAVLRQHAGAAARTAQLIIDLTAR